MELAYDAKWVDSPEGRPLSLSLPFNLDGRPIAGERVEWFFDNLLPDNDVIRRRIRSRFHTPAETAFDLLEAVGRDCVGAVQLLPEGVEPSSKVSLVPLGRSDIEKLLRGVASEPSAFDDDDEFRISIAGAQEKTALAWDGRWCKPHGSTPTTHIFKLPLGFVGGRKLDMRNSLENEWLCSRILAHFGVPTAECEVMQFGDERALVVTRFDRVRKPSKRGWLRLPQEDLCQATGTPSSRKYESDGGPGMVEIANVLHGSESRDDDLATLLRAQLLFWMLAATDGHAKNFSIRLLPGGRYRLTPLYDVLSAWPIAGSRHDQVHPKKLRLAMSLRGTRKKHDRVSEIARRHFDATAQKCGYGRDMSAVVDDVRDKTQSVIDRVAGELPKGFPGALFDVVTSGLKRSARAL